MQYTNYSRDVVMTMVQMQRRLAGNHGIRIALDDEHAPSKLMQMAHACADKVLISLANALSIELYGEVYEPAPKVEAVAEKVTEPAAVDKPATRRIVYRGQVIEKPIEDDDEGGLAKSTTPRVYRGAVMS